MTPKGTTTLVSGTYIYVYHAAYLGLYPYKYDM